MPRTTKAVKPASSAVRKSAEDWLATQEAAKSAHRVNLSLVELDLEMKLMNNRVMTSSIRDLRVRSDKVKRKILKWAKSYVERNPPDVGRVALYEDWKAIRLYLSLQLRLHFEQVFWDLGGWYRQQLVTGFRPLPGQKRP